MRMHLKQKVLLIALICLSAALETPAQDTDIRRDATVNAVQEVMPSVVNIAAKGTEPVRDPFERLRRQMWGQQPYDDIISYGSGVVIDENGYILTNDHVIRGATQIQVRFGTGTKEYEAVVVKSDEKSDVALLKLKARPGEKFHAIKMAKEDDLLLGETVLALGNPLNLGGSVTRGILSSKSRMAPREGEELTDRNWLQTDAPINRGNSGGPLVDLRGQLIGINVATLDQTPNGEPVQGIGFAIPIRIVEDALYDIFPTEFVRSYWFGARVKIGSYPLVITSVQPDSPAGKAGLRAGDVVMQVNGTVPKTFIEFGDLIASNAENEFPITYRRGDTTSDATLRLVPESSVFNAQMVRQKLGLTLEKAADGFVITKVQPDSPAAKAGLAPQMLIWAVDREAPPADVTGLAKLLYAKKKGDTVVLHILTLEQAGGFNVLRRNVVELTPR
ncbi:MAG TPA: trypsin-like peptidase domain-containing protein [Candidatus Angelobacter sp.]|nr:trypsin-like peptidase domain-containing protein [Candidatus Angelobacter sp.]